MSGHKWVPSKLGHSSLICEYCASTPKEVEALGEMNICHKASVSTSTLIPGVVTVEGTKFKAKFLDLVAFDSDVNFDEALKTFIVEVKKMQGYDTDPPPEWYAMVGPPLKEAIRAHEIALGIRSST